MVYIYKKIVGGKPYYYLRLSQRVDGKVITKDVAYLGSDVSKIQNQLDGLPKKYQANIRKSYRNIKRFIESHYFLDKIEKLKENQYLSKNLHREIEATRLHFQTRFLKFPHQTIRDTYEGFLIEFAHNTTSIEGNTITLKEVAKLLMEDLTPKERTSREIFDLQNTKKTFFYLFDEKPAFDEELIIKIHDLLLENIDVRKGYRTHDIRVFKSRFKASDVQYISKDMKLLFKWYGTNKKKLHPLVLASLFHQKFEHIHPFSDGNGRTGRMVLNYMLLLHEYPPTIIKKKNRSEYLAALAKGDRTAIDIIDPAIFKELVNYVGAELVDSYWNNFNI